MSRSSGNVNGQGQQGLDGSIARRYCRHNVLSRRGGRLTRPLSRAQRQAETRESLVRATGELLGAKTYSELTLREVAARAGCTTGAVFAHFTSKADLVAEVLSRQGDHSVAFLLGAVDKALKAKDDVRAGRLLVSLFDDMRPEAGMQLDLLSQALRDERLAERLGDIMSAGIDALAGMQALGTLPPKERRQVASQVVALWQGLALQGITQPTLDVAVAFARGARALINAGAR
jgi:AcrR family transcriptional regulator